MVRSIEKIAQKATQGAFAMESIYVFDIYEGEGLPAGKKSVAVSMVFRSSERTLKDKEVNTAFEKIQNVIREKTAFEIRD